MTALIQRNEDQNPKASANTGAYEQDLSSQPDRRRRCVYCDRHEGEITSVYQDSDLRELTGEFYHLYKNAAGERLVRISGPSMLPHPETFIGLYRLGLSPVASDCQDRKVTVKLGHEVSADGTREEGPCAAMHNWGREVQCLDCRRYGQRVFEELDRLVAQLSSVVVEFPEHPPRSERLKAKINQRPPLG